MRSGNDSIFKDKEKPVKVLLINPFGIGDLLFATPLIEVFKKNCPRASLSFICNKRTFAVIERCPDIDDIFVFEKGDYRTLWKKDKWACIRKFLSFVKEINERRFDCAIDMSMGRQYGFFLMLINIAQRVGFDYKKRGRFHTRRLAFDGFNDKPIAEYYKDLLRFIGLEAKDEPTRIWFTDEERRFADNFFKEEAISSGDIAIGIAPGGGVSFGKDINFKRWPEDKFAKLADSLIKELSCKVILFWGPGEESLIKRITARMDRRPVIAPKTGIRELAACMAKCSLVVCNDTGPLHIAVAAGAKTVSVFGPSDENVYGPYPRDSRHITVVKDIECRPCYKKFKISACRNLRCLNELDYREVMKAVVLQMAGRGDRWRGQVPLFVEASSQKKEPVPVDIIIPVWNEYEYTKRCIESIKRSTHIPYRLILVDNNSEPKTTDYLRGLAANDDSIILIRNSENLGFIKAANQGLRQSSTPYLCLMNNDTVATDGWLEKMMRLAQVDTRIGLVNPKSESPGNLSIDEYSRHLAENKEQYIETNQCMGFCMLIKREVIDKIGYLDEAYGIGGFDDTDFSKRVALAGYKCVCSLEAYVYHDWHTSFKKAGNREALVKRNEKIFSDRWGEYLRIGYPVIYTSEENLYIDINTSLGLAREWHWVHAWLNAGRPLKEKMRLMKIPEHQSLRLFNMTGIRPLFYLEVLFRLIERGLKKRKLFDVVVVSDKGMFKFLSMFKKVLGAPLFYLDNTRFKCAQTEEGWRKRAREIVDFVKEALKPEARNPKFETSTKSEFSNDQNSQFRTFEFL